MSLHLVQLQAQDISFDNPSVVQAIRAQAEHDYDKAQALFEEYIATLSDKEQMLYHDLAQVAFADDLEIYRDATLEQRHVLTSRFWQRLDPSPLTLANERLVEHYRRVFYARQQYGKGQFPWDDRGEIFVRFGEPDHVSKSSDIQNEMDRDIQDARQNYVNQRRISLRITPGQPIFPVPSLSWWEYWVYVDLDEGTEFDFVRRSKKGAYEFAPMPEGLGMSLTSDLMEYHSEMVLRQVAARQPSVYEVDFADLPVDFFYYPVGFRGEDGQTRLEIYYGLPASEMARLPVNDKTDRVMLDRGLAMFDSLWVEVHRVQDQLTFNAPSEQQVLDGAFIPGVLAFGVDSGLHYLSFQVRDVVSGKSQVYQQSLDIADYSDTKYLLMSDIALA
ncbi:MAG: GWxTD domain-containing protein, partial [Candidatus Latescibacteria bacterium]|nr:GWxTD domain-containing protein [Candidatus Latescibacterota bacterium]